MRATPCHLDLALASNDQLSADSRLLSLKCLILANAALQSDAERFFTERRANNYDYQAHTALAFTAMSSNTINKMETAEAEIEAELCRRRLAA